MHGMVAESMRGTDHPLSLGNHRPTLREVIKLTETD